MEKQPTTDAPKPAKTYLHKIIKNPVFKAAKQEAELCLSEGFAEATFDNTDWLVYSHPQSSHTTYASTVLLDAAVKMVHPAAFARINDDDGDVELFFPASVPLPVTAETLAGNVSTLRHAMLEAIQQDARGNYILNSSKAFGPLDPHEFMQTLAAEFALSHGVADYDDPSKELDWSALPEEARPCFETYYCPVSPESWSIGMQDKLHDGLLTREQFEQLNSRAAEMNEPLHSPVNTFDHAAMNDAMMTMLSSAIGIKPSRAVMH